MKISDQKDVTEMFRYKYRPESSEATKQAIQCKIFLQRWPNKVTPKEYYYIGNAGWIKPKAYRATVHRFGYVPIARRTTYLTAPNKNYGPKIEVFSVDPNPTIPNWVWVLMNNNETQANVDFLNKINERKISLAEELLNGRETINTIATSVNRLARMLKQAKRDPVRFVRSGRRKMPKNSYVNRNIKNLGDVWLEGRYHWLPTYMTMRDAVSALTDIYPVKRVKHKSERYSYDFSQTKKAADVAEVHFDYTVYVQYQRGCMIRMADEGAAQLRKLGIAGLTDYATVAWELTPWSLVVDWVLPVANLLNAMSALRGVTTFNDWQTRKIKIKRTDLRVEYEPVYENGLYRIDAFEYASPDRQLFEYEQYTRGGAATASLAIQPFIDTTPYTWRRAIDSLAFFSGSEMSRKVISGKT